MRQLQYRRFQHGPRKWRNDTTPHIQIISPVYHWRSIIFTPTYTYCLYLSGIFLLSFASHTVWVLHHCDNNCMECIVLHWKWVCSRWNNLDSMLRVPTLFCLQCNCKQKCKEKRVPRNQTYKIFHIVCTSSKLHLFQHQLLLQIHSERDE